MNQINNIKDNMSNILSNTTSNSATVGTTALSHGDKQNGRLIIALGRAMQRSHRQSTAMLRLNGLTPAQFTVLEALYHKGELTIQQIIDSVLGSSGNMTVVIRNLEQQALVRRIENPRDRRSFLIGITDAGRKLMDVVFPLHMGLVGETLSALSEDDKLCVINILKKIL